jgi:hypothetical protein
MKKIIYCILAVVVALPTLAQTPSAQWQWVKSFTSNAEIQNAVVDNDGNIYFISSTIYNFTFPGKSLLLYGSSDIFLGKMDANGTVLWLKTAGGTRFDSGNAIAIDKNNNIVITGSFSSTVMYFDSLTVNLTDSSTYTTDLFIAKYDSSGKALWAKSTKGRSSEQGRAVTFDNNNNIYLTGDYVWAADLRFDSLTIPQVNYTSQAFFAKLNPNGDFLWVEGAICSSSTAYSIATDANGDLCVGGFYGGTLKIGAVTGPNSGTGKAQFFIVKLDTAGNCIWASATQTDVNGITKGSLAIDNSNNIVAAFTGKASFGRKPYLFKFNTQGQMVWEKMVNNILSARNDDCNSLTLDANDNIYISGAFYSNQFKISTDIILNNTNYDAATRSDTYIVKYDSAGGVVWAKNGRGKGYDFGFALVTNKGNIYQFGQTGGDTLFLDSLACESGANLNINILYLAAFSECLQPLTTITQNGDSLTVTQSANYQWYFNGDSIKGATSKIYYAPKSGRYTVSHKEAGGCINVSAPYDFIKTGIDKLSADAAIKVYPNPSMGNFTVMVPQNTQKVVIFNTSGQLVKQYSVEGSTSLDIELLQSGIYFINVYTESQVITEKVVVVR